MKRNGKIIEFNDKEKKIKIPFRVWINKQQYFQ